MPSVLVLRLNDSEKQLGTELPSDSHWVVLVCRVSLCFVFSGCGLVEESLVWFCLFDFPPGTSPFIVGQFWSPGIKVSNLRGSDFPKGLRSTPPGNCSETEHLPDKPATVMQLLFSSQCYMIEQLKEHKVDEKIIPQWDL